MMNIRMLCSSHLSKIHPYLIMIELDKGIMIRRDAETEEIVGYTVRNISAKILKSYIDDSLLKISIA